MTSKPSPFDATLPTIDIRNGRDQGEQATAYRAADELRNRGIHALAAEYEREWAIAVCVFQGEPSAMVPNVIWHKLSWMHGNAINCANIVHQYTTNHAKSWGINEPK